MIDVHRKSRFSYNVLGGTVAGAALGYIASGQNPGSLLLGAYGGYVLGGWADNGLYNNWYETNTINKLAFPKN